MGKWVTYSLKSPPDKFKQKLFEAIASIPDEVAAKDWIRLEARFLLRHEGRCVIGHKSGQWAALLRKLNEERGI